MWNIWKGQKQPGSHSCTELSKSSSPLSIVKVQIKGKFRRFKGKIRVRIYFFPSFCLRSLSIYTAKVITRLMLKCLRSGQKWYRVVKEIDFPFPSCLVNRECLWKKPKLKKVSFRNLSMHVLKFSIEFQNAEIY